MCLAMGTGLLSMMKDDNESFIIIFLWIAIQAYLDYEKDRWIILEYKGG